jgi:phosphoglycolate phosphatase-like HAD superfamily hydrolase
MVGDTPYDAEAARKASVMSVGVLCGGIFGAEDIYIAGAVSVFRDPEDLRAHLDEVLFGQDAHASGP